LGGLFLALLNLILTYGRTITTIQLTQDLSFTIHNILIIGIVSMIIGAVLTSRLYLKAHNIQDVYGGFLVGMISQIIALRFFF